MEILVGVKTLVGKLYRLKSVGTSMNIGDRTHHQTHISVIFSQIFNVRSLVPLMDEIRSQIGNAPCYLSFDIDAIDPGFCPGTGTPEIGF